jgi:hypothetical protein
MLIILQDVKLNFKTLLFSYFYMTAKVKDELFSDEINDNYLLLQG